MSEQLPKSPTPVHPLFSLVKWEELPPPSESGDGLPYATHQGVLSLNGIKLECVVLNTGQRLFTGESVERLFAGMTDTPPHYIDKATPTDLNQRIKND